MLQIGELAACMGSGLVVVSVEAQKRRVQSVKLYDPLE